MAARSRVLMDPRVDAWKALQAGPSGSREPSPAATRMSPSASSTPRPWPPSSCATLTARPTTCVSARCCCSSSAPMPRRNACSPTCAPSWPRLATGRSMAMPRWKRSGQKSRPRMMQRVALQLIDPAPRPRVMRPMHCRPASACTPRTPTPGASSRLSGRAWASRCIIRAQAETRAAAGDINGAIDRLRSGLRQSRQPNADQVEASVIEARLRALVYARQACWPRCTRAATSRLTSSCRTKPTLRLGSLPAGKRRSISTSITIPHRL